MPTAPSGWRVAIGVGSVEFIQRWSCVSLVFGVLNVVEPLHPRRSHPAPSENPACGHGLGGVWTCSTSTRPTRDWAISLWRADMNHAFIRHRNTMLSATSIECCMKSRSLDHGGLVTIQSQCPRTSKKSRPSSISHQSHPGIARTNAPVPLHGSRIRPHGMKCCTIILAVSSGVIIRSFPPRGASGRRTSR